MKKTLQIMTLALAALAGTVKADENDKPALKRGELLKELPASLNESKAASKRAADSAFKPSIQVGSIVHMFASAQQKGFGSGTAVANASDYAKGFSLYRARVLVGGQLSKKGSFFLETEIPSIIGSGGAAKNVKVSPIILDCQYEHNFSNSFSLVAGMQLVSNNRNGLQGAAALMANDFTYFQYPYNLFASDPLQGNFGRDLGVNARGFFAKDKLEYRLGLFTGRNMYGTEPLRVVGRLAYNFLDAEKDYYYAGTKLGKGKTLAWGVGFDTQASYYNLSTDVFLDKPLGPAGSITLNAAYQHMTGGTSTSKYSFAGLIPKQNVQFLELGYYFTKSKLQPWIRYEKQKVDAETEQAGGVDLSTFNKMKSGGTVFGGGVNYFFNAYGTNLRLSYTTRTLDVMQTPTSFKKETYGQVWAQLQFFIF